MRVGRPALYFSPVSYFHNSNKGALCVSAKGKGGSTVAAVWPLAESVAQSLGLKLWDIRFLKEGATWYLRFFIDKDGGVSMDDCVNFSHAIDGPLDEADPIEQSYCMEVSSPGVERELTREEHFTVSLGQKVKVRLIRPLNDRRNYAGVLESYENGQLTLRLEDGTGLCVEKKETSRIQLDDFDKFGGAQA